jgi:hypothetical protein
MDARSQTTQTRITSFPMPVRQIACGVTTVPSRVLRPVRLNLHISWVLDEPDNGRVRLIDNIGFMGEGITT